MRVARSRMGLGMTIAAWTVMSWCAASTPARADDDDERENPRLAGAWQILVNPGPQQFHGLVIYHRDNTQSATTTLPFLSPAKGVWKKLPGRGRYAITHETFWDCPSALPPCTGVFEAVIRTRGTVQVADDDTLSGTLSSDFLLLDGTLLFQTRGSFIGTRMRVVPE